MYMKTLIILVCAAMSAAAQGGKPPAQRAVPAIQFEQMATIADRVRAIRAVPSTIIMHVGQVAPLDTVHVFAIDANGQDIGRLVGFNFVIKPGEPVTAVPGRITALRKGSTTMRVAYPSVPWGTRTRERPAAIVKIIVNR